MNKFLQKFFIASTAVLLFVAVVMPLSSQAQNIPSKNLPNNNSKNTNTNTPANNKPANNTTTTTTTYDVGPTDFDTPVGGSLRRLIDADSIPGLIIRLMKILMALLGTVAIIVILISAFRMITSQGNQESLKAGKAGVTWAIIGIVVSLLSYSIVAILQSFLGIQ